MGQNDGLNADSPELTVDTRRLARYVLIFCIAAEVAFLVLDYQINYGNLVQVGAIRRLFNIAREDGLASWFGTTQTFLVGLTLWLIFILTRRRRGPGWESIGWLVLAAFFTYMAMDDGAKVHERLGTTVEVLMGESTMVDIFPSYTWQLILMPFFGIMGIFILGFLWFQLGTASARILIVTALGILTIAVVMDFFEGLDRDHPWNFYTWISKDFDVETWKRVGYFNELEAWTQLRFGKPAYDTLRHFSKAIEEAIEMLANSIFWFLFLRHLSVAAGDFRIGFKRGR